nr:hypothetical protein [Tanacetum cinerariifolium]
MSRDVLTVGSTMRILLLFRGEHSQWSERFMNYLKEQMDEEAMINSIKNVDQPFPTVTQVSITGATSRLPNDIYSLIDSNKSAKDLWDALERHMLSSEYGDVNDAIKSKKKTVMITSDPLALVAEQTKVSKRKEKVLVSSESEGSDDEKRLEVVEDEDDDVFVDATPLASKVPVMDYQIVLIDNKPRFKIIRADKTHQFYISFATLLKNFDKEDLETLWRIVKDRFSTSKPTNFSDEYLLLTLKIMFEEPDGQDSIWRNQKSVHGLALVKIWKLLTSCGVHVITLSTIQLFLLVERRYPLSRFTLEQLVNVTRL